jgi:L-fucose mutarotase/ribose pyranase (RbsD/FucU family)
MTSSSASAETDWKPKLSSILPLFGHRNWIVVADSAYPAQSKPGIETVVSGGDQLAVVQHVLDAIAACKHIRANVYADKELAYVMNLTRPASLSTAASSKRCSMAPALRTCLTKRSFKNSINPRKSFAYCLSRPK